MIMSGARAFYMLIAASGIGGGGGPGPDPTGDCDPFVRTLPTGMTLNLPNSVTLGEPVGDTLHICREVT